MSDENAMEVATTSKVTAEQQKDQQTTRTNETDGLKPAVEEVDGVVVEATASAATAPVTPKSFHSTRSSFKKSSQLATASATAGAVEVDAGATMTTTTTTTMAINSSHHHIYDYPTLSSLNSSRRSSLHGRATTVEITTAAANAIPSSTVAPMGCALLTNNALDRVFLTDENPEIISFTDSMSTANVIVKEPIVIRGAGNLTIFGVSNKFCEQFPQALTAKLAPEEFRDTIKQINSILNKELENSFKWLVVGSLFCCCTLGCSLLPVIYLNKKAKLCINKLLDFENQRMYKKLGLRWRLTKLKCNSNNLFEYVLLIEFLPVLSLYQPD